MNLDVLMNMYSNDPRIFTIADKILLPEPKHMHLSGLAGSASQFVFSAVFSSGLMRGLMAGFGPANGAVFSLEGPQYQLGKYGLK